METISFEATTAAYIQVSIDSTEVAVQTHSTELMRVHIGTQPAADTTAYILTRFIDFKNTGASPVWVRAHKDKVFGAAMRS